MKEKNVRGLRAASPPPVTPRATGEPTNEIAAILSDIERTNAEAGLVRATGPTPLPTAPKTIRRIENDHDYEAAGPGTFTTLKGVVLKVKPFSNELVIRTQQRMIADRPKPPETWSDADQKMYTDDSDPAYREALGAYITQASNISFDLRVAIGTELLPEYPLPAEIIPLDDDRWIEEITDPILVGPYAVEVRRDSKGRYLDWLQYYVFGEGDIRHLYEALDHASGIVREVAVIDAVKSFRGTD